MEKLAENRVKGGLDVEPYLVKATPTPESPRKNGWSQKSIGCYVIAR